MSVFNEIRTTLSGKSLVSVQVLLKVNYCLKYSCAHSTVKFVYFLPELSFIIDLFIGLSLEVNVSYKKCIVVISFFLLKSVNFTLF